MCVVPVSATAGKHLSLLLVNRAALRDTDTPKKSVSRYGVGALERLMLTLTQEQRHRESLNQVNFTLSQVGHELSMVTEGILQRGALLRKYIDQPEERLRFLKNIMDELELLGALRDKTIYYNQLLGGRGLAIRRGLIDFYRDVIRPKVNLLTSAANARSIYIDYNTALRAFVWVI